MSHGFIRGLVDLQRARRAASAACGVMEFRTPPPPGVTAFAASAAVLGRELTVPGIGKAWF